MKTIGLLGGMSWESSVTYYQIINEEVKRRRGGLHSAKCLLYSVNFGEIEFYQRNNQWNKAATVLLQAAQSLEKAGADFLLICTNTMHKVAAEIQAGIAIPLLHIADLTAAKILEAGLQTIGLVGTSYTMEEDFYKGRLEAKGLKVLIPEQQARKTVNEVIFTELCLGLIKENSQAKFRAVINDLAEAGAEGIILGCTEIGLLVKPEDSPVPLFDTTQIHALGAVDYALQEE
jgi:aspartate racemase